MNRKTDEQMKILVELYSLYEGYWDDAKFSGLIEQTGFTKKQLNKWFWDRKKKEQDLLQAKKLSYPGLIFQITDMRDGSDKTPSFSALAQRTPIFKIEKVTRCH